MTDRSAISQQHNQDRAGRCTACGQPYDDLSDGCCPHCGSRIGDEKVTSEDRTPYAQARSRGERGWAAMCRWVYGAGKQRLNHLGLLRPSAASLRFVRINTLLFATCVMLSAFANSGWQEVSRLQPQRSMSPTPVGKGWLHCIERDLTGPHRFSDRRQSTDLWWNVPQAVLASAVSLVAATLVCFVLLRLVGGGSQRALTAGYRSEPRLRCAVHYGSAWLHPISVAALILVLRPIAAVVRTAGWAKFRSAAVFDVPAVLLALLGALLWWFWLIRLAETVPKEARSKVSRFFVLWSPLLVVVVLGGVGYGFHVGIGWMATVLNLAW